MPDDPPISTTVPETVTIDTGADKAQLGNLNDDFKDFWNEQDNKAAQEKDPPAAPGEGAGQETREKEPDEPEKAKTVEHEPAPESPPATESDIDKMELPPSARPEHQVQFNKIKSLWKADQRRAEEYSRKLQAAEQQLNEARQNAWTPETRADYEHAASVRRRFDFVSDPEFIQRFHNPIRVQFEKVIEQAVPILSDRVKARAWADDIKANYDPDGLNRHWWLHDVVDKVPDELEKASLLGSVNKLLDLQNERNEEINRRTNNRSAFDNYITEREQLTATRVQQEIMAEIGAQEGRLKEVFPVDVSKAKTNEEREAMEKHNERFTKLNEHFVKTVRDISEHGPRAWVRAAMEATRTQIMDEQITELEKENKSVKTERDKLKAELDKIVGARRKIAHTTGTAPSAGDKKNGQGLSIKDLSDPRKALNNYWDEIDRNT